MEEAARDTAPSMETFAHHMHRASELLCNRQPMRACEHLQRAIAMLPNNPAARNLLALSYFQLGNLEHALAIYASLEREFPTSVAAKVNHALVRLKLGQPERARELLERAVATNPDHRRAWGYLGVALEQLGRIDEAEQALLAGHYSGAARGLRKRHGQHHDGRAQSVPEINGEAARTAMPALTYRRKTLPPDPWAPSVAGSATLAFHGPHRYSGTLRPPDFSPAGADAADRGDAPPRSSHPKVTDYPADGVDEIPFDTTVAPLPPPPGAPSAAPKQSRPVIPLLDAALSSLLVIPHEASVVAHPAGLVIVGLLEGDVRDAGFAANVHSVLATAGALKRESIPRRDPHAARPLGAGGDFVRIAGSGQLVLGPPPGSRLLPLQMDADVAFLRDDLVIAFDLGLLYDLGRIRRPSGAAVSLVRFRGDGVIVLKLDRPFLGLDVRGEEAVTLRTDTLVGWIGLLAPEPVAHDGSEADDFMSFSGEGTVLFRAPLEA